MTQTKCKGLRYTRELHLCQFRKQVADLRAQYPVARVLANKVREDVREFAGKVHADFQRAKWQYLHPEILGDSGSPQGLGNTQWLDPLAIDRTGTDRTSYTERRANKQIWSWAEAPDIIMGDESVAPMGKLLATGALVASNQEGE